MASCLTSCWQWNANKACSNCKKPFTAVLCNDGVFCNNCGLELEGQIFDEAPEYHIYDNDSAAFNASMRADAPLPATNTTTDATTNKPMQDAWDLVDRAFATDYPNKNMEPFYVKAKAILATAATATASTATNSIHSIKGITQRACYIGAAVYMASKTLHNAALRIDELEGLLIRHLPTIDAPSIATKLKKAVTDLSRTPVQQQQQQHKTQNLEAHIRRMVNGSVYIAPGDKKPVIDCALKVAANIAANMAQIPELANSQPAKVAATIIVIVTVSILKCKGVTMDNMAMETKTSKTKINQLKNVLLKLV